MTQSQTAIPCSVIRGGTSRGLYFCAADLPEDEAVRDRVLLAILGGPDALQVDGIGGGHPLTNKVAIVGPSERNDADVDYLFLQVSADTQKVSAVQNCGNILAGVGPFSLDQGMVVAGDEKLLDIEHPSGSFCVRLTVDTDAAPELLVRQAGVIRTARTLMHGSVFVPKEIWTD